MRYLRAIRLFLLIVWRKGDVHPEASRISIRTAWEVASQIWLAPYDGHKWKA